MQQNKLRAGVAMLGVVLSSAACQDLQVDNMNAPDRDRALASAADVENLIVGTFPVLWEPLHGRANSALLFSAWGQEGVTTSQVGGIWLAATQQPVQPLLNNSNINRSTGPTGPELAWLDFHRVASSANDGLVAIQSGAVQLPSVAEAERAKAVAYFVRGLAWGYLANGWAQATVIDETVDFGSDANSVVRENIKNYEETLAASIASLDKAIAIASAQNIQIPSVWFSTAADIRSPELIRIANSFKAKFMVYNARTPAERAQVNWNEVLRLTAAGVTDNFAPITSDVSGGLDTSYLLQMQLNSRGGLQQSRADYEWVGPADVSGNWQAYAALPLLSRRQIEITTPDRRVQGPGGPKDSGSYFRFVVNPGNAPDSQYGFITDRGLYNFSNYQWYRYGGAFNNLALPMMGVVENRLIRAEALLRTGNTQGAVDLINVTRTAPQRIGNTTYPNLPALTTANVVPGGDNCVPQRRDGSCGNLQDALFYERRMELTNVDALRAYTDARGFGFLRPGTLIHMPIPGRELEALGIADYTFGGVGGNCAFGSACVLPDFN